MITTYKFRLFPKHKHVRLMERVLDSHRILYNAALEQRKTAWQERHIGLSYSKQANELKDLRATTDELHGTNYSSCQQTLRRLDKSFQNFFRRVQQSAEKVGYPRFKSKDRFNTVEFVYGDGCKVNQQFVYLQHIGNVKIVLHREIVGTIKRLAITRRADKWFLIVTCETESSNPNSLPDAVGIDVGLESFATLSTGETIENPRFLRQDEKDLKRAQRKLSKLAKGTKERQRAQKIVSRIHERITNRRNNFAHQESRKLANRFGFVAFENLNIQNMLANHHLAKSIVDVAWNQFVTYTTYKVEKTGGCVVQIDPRGTSQICSGCGEKVVKSLSVRVHHCNCGLNLSRDHNAALNILRIGTTMRGLNSQEAARL